MQFLCFNRLLLFYLGVVDMTLRVLLVANVLHVLIHYITQQHNDALCEQSLLCTENNQLHCFIADSKLQFNNNDE